MNATPATAVARASSWPVAEHDWPVADDGAVDIDKHLRSGPKRLRTSAHACRQTRRHHAPRTRDLRYCKSLPVSIHTPGEHLSARAPRSSVALNTESSKGNVEAGLPSASWGCCGRRNSCHAASAPSLRAPALNTQAWKSPTTAATLALASLTQAPSKAKLPAFRKCAGIARHSSCNWWPPKARSRSISSRPPRPPTSPPLAAFRSPATRHRRTACSRAVIRFPSALSCFRRKAAGRSPLPSMF